MNDRLAPRAKIIYMEPVVNGLYKTKLTPINVKRIMITIRDVARQIGFLALRLISPKNPVDRQIHPSLFSVIIFDNPP